MRRCSSTARAPVCPYAWLPWSTGAPRLLGALAAPTQGLTPRVRRRLVLWRRCWLVYVESIARVETLSLSGKILYRIADQMFVQWPQLQRKYPGVLCVGRLY